jgi:ribonuclease BN (tRNA processing enzyme)
MKVKFYGTRGSVPVAGAPYNKYGGNTTSIHVQSECVPNDYCLIVDAGTGVVPLGKKVLEEGMRGAILLFSHLHHDHTQGLLLCPATFKNDFKFECYGPEEQGIGPYQMLKSIMQAPFHPVNFAEVAHHFRCKGIRNPKAEVLVVHSEGGVRLLEVDEFILAEEKEPAQLEIRGGVYPINECLVIRMIGTHHPQRAISYRFEERPTGRVFVFMTDHENTDGISRDLICHLQGADTMAIDCQYPRWIYDKFTANFGHSTPDYCVRLAAETGVAELGLTHHDPLSTDENVDQILEEARVAANNRGYAGKIFALADFDEIMI